MKCQFCQQACTGVKRKSRRPADETREVRPYGSFQVAIFDILIVGLGTRGLKRLEHRATRKVIFIAEEPIVRSRMISRTITITVSTLPRLTHALTGKPSSLL